MSNNKLTEDKFFECIDTVYKCFNFMHLRTTEISYDERFDSAIYTNCKPFMQEICLCCSNAMSFLSLSNKCQDDNELEYLMTAVCVNCVFYLVTCKKNIEWYVDNLIICMTEDSVGELIDEYVRNMNVIFKQLYDIFNPYITDEIHELIKQFEYELDNQDDIDDEFVT